jgi:hypothetical protein
MFFVQQNYKLKSLGHHCGPEMCNDDAVYQKLNFIICLEHGTFEKSKTPKNMETLKKFELLLKHLLRRHQAGTYQNLNKPTYFHLIIVQHGERIHEYADIVEIEKVVPTLMDEMGTRLFNEWAKVIKLNIAFPDSVIGHPEISERYSKIFKKVKSHKVVKINEVARHAETDRIDGYKWQHILAYTRPSFNEVDVDEHGRVVVKKQILEDGVIIL